jgi:DNA-binding transcriptional regulator LsrR (DeoR family)
MDGVAGVAADYVDTILRSNMRLGISWGRTLAAVVRRLRPGSVRELTIAQLAGGIDDPEPGIQGYALASELATRFEGSQVHFVHAPAIVASARVRKALLKDPSIVSSLGVARRSELALVGIGQMDGAATLVRGGHVSPADYECLCAAGAVGNLNTRFFDAEGRPVAELEPRTMAIDWADIRAIGTVVAVAAGSDKVAAIAGALRTGCVDVLVTNETTAHGVLELAPR